jgi:hypothetical protein
MVLLVILPVFAAIIEKFILLEKTEIIRSAVDMANISAYNALNAGSLGKVTVNFDHAEMLDIFEELLSDNLRLDKDLEPEPGSIAEGQVVISSLEIYCSGLPVRCPDDVLIDRPSVHSCIDIPIKPSLYTGVILKLLGKENIVIKVHVDSEIPINN